MRMPWSTQPLCSQGVDSAVPPVHSQEQHSPIPLNAPPTVASALLRRASCFCFSQPQNKIPLHPRERTKQLRAEFVPPKGHCSLSQSYTEQGPTGHSKDSSCTKFPKYSKKFSIPLPAKLKSPHSSSPGVQDP